MRVESWGTGRKDYSTNVEFITNPTIKNWQAVARASGTFSLSPYQTKTITVDLSLIEGASSHFITNIVISADANVLLSADIHPPSYSHRIYGYQKLIMDIPHALPLSDFSVLVTNHSNQTINCKYFYVGSQGYELVRPIVKRIRLW